MQASLEADARWMARAIDLADARLGRTAPNPSVGCVLVAENAVIAEGVTGDGGRPHAEEAALEQAGAGARGATAYVTLEPCAVRSSGAPSCSERLIEAGVARVVAACPDPHPNGSGGFARLAAAGIPYEVGVLGDRGDVLNAGFFKVVRENRPLVGLDADGLRYDAAFYLGRGESFETALIRMAGEGLTRVWVAPNSPLAAALKSRGLIDLDAESTGPR